MSAVDLKEKLTANCQTAMYEVSDRTTFKTNELAASDVLVLDVQGSPHLHIVQVYAYPVTISVRFSYYASVYCGNCKCWQTGQHQWIGVFLFVGAYSSIG